MSYPWNIALITLYNCAQKEQENLEEVSLIPENITDNIVYQCANLKRISRSISYP